MSDHRPPDKIKKSSKPFRIPKDFLVGAGMGVILWIIISHAVENWWMGALFGLIPGLVVGLGLQLTRKEK